MDTIVTITVPRTPEEIEESARLQKIAASPVLSRLYWVAVWLAYRAVLLLPSGRLFHALLPMAGVYAYAESFHDWRDGWAQWTPPAETMPQDERRKWLSAIADVLDPDGKTTP